METFEIVIRQIGPYMNLCQPSTGDPDAVAEALADLREIFEHLKSVPLFFFGSSYYVS